MEEEDEYNVHVGPYEQIPDEATPGLLFLREWFQKYDSSGPFEQGPKRLVTLIFKDTEFFYDSNKSVSPTEELKKLLVRNLKDVHIERIIHLACDRWLKRSTGARRVLVQSTVTVRLATDQSILDKTTTITAMDLRPAGGDSKDIKLDKMRTHTLNSGSSDEECGPLGQPFVVMDI